MNANEFLYAYLNNASPTGFEASGQKIWLDYIQPFIDEKIIDYLDYVRDPNGLLKTLDTIMDYIEYSVSPILATDSVNNNNNNVVKNNDNEGNNTHNEEKIIYS